jgi:hypothetical protein
LSWYGKMERALSLDTISSGVPYSSVTSFPKDDTRCMLIIIMTIYYWSKATNWKHYYPQIPLLLLDQLLLHHLGSLLEMQNIRPWPRRSGSGCAL